MRKAKWVFTAGYLAVAAAMATMTGQVVAAEAPVVGEPAPAFELEGTDGKPHKLADHKGKIVVIHFQSTTCPWERAYQPILNQVSQAHGDKVVFLGINANKNESMEQVKAMVEKESIPYVITKDPGNKVADAYSANVTPHIFVIDDQGVLRYKGGIEKAPLSPGEAGKSEEQYLVPVLTALIEGKTLPATDTKAIGCTIKRE